MTDGINTETHNTCTSNKKLEQTPGSQRENINVDVLNRLYEKQHGFSVSNDPVIARIQREQAIVRDKREQRSNKINNNI